MTSYERKLNSKNNTPSLKLKKLLNFQTYSLAGLGSGVTEAILVNPFEVVKVKMQSNRSHQKESPSTFKVMKEIIHQDGVMGRNGLLGKGITATMGRNGFFNMVYFGFYHTVKDFVPQVILSIK